MAQKKDPFHVDIPEVLDVERRPLFQFSETSVMVLIAGMLLTSIVYVGHDYLTHKERVAALVPQHLRSTHDAVALMLINQQNLAQSVNQMAEVVARRDALNQIETRVRAGGDMSDAQARKLLLRAGYKPHEIDAQKIAETKQRHATTRQVPKGVADDVDFARDVASDLVREEVESFAHKMRLLSEVGAYIFNRVSD